MRYKNLKYTYNVTGLAIIIFLTIRETCSLVLLRTGLEKSSPLFIGISMAVFLLACFVPVVVMENMLGMHPVLFKKTNPMQSAATAAFGYMVILAAGILNNIVLGMLKGVGLQFAPDSPQIPDGAVSMILYFIYICVLPPVLEEIFVRGLIFNALRGWGVPFAVGISSAIFALMHSSLHNFLLYFVCGVVLAKIYLAFDSLLPCMLLHFVNNSLSFVQIAFQQRANAVSAISLTAYIVIMAIVFGWAGLKYMRKTGVNMAFSFVRVKDAGAKFGTIFKSYVGLTAILLLLFLAAYQSFQSLLQAV